MDCFLGGGEVLLPVSRVLGILMLIVRVLMWIGVMVLIMHTIGDFNAGVLLKYELVILSAC